MVWRLAFRNFWLHRGRFRSIAVSLAIGLAVIVMLLGITQGMTAVLDAKAAKYFGGDVVIFNLWGNRQIHDADTVTRVLESNSQGGLLTKRSEYFRGDSVLYFHGQSIRQRKLVGVDWKEEGPLFQTLELTAGSLPSVNDDQSIVISESTASRLPGVGVGSKVIAQFLTDSGQHNTAPFEVAAIYRDTSFFGYASYVGLKTMNSMVGRPSEAVTGLGLVLPAGVSSVLVGKELVQALSPLTPTYTLIHNRRELLTASSDAKGLQNGDIAVVSLAANLAEITSLLEALLAVAFVSVFTFLAIVVIGVGNTYRMIIFERTKELGTLRAMGLTSGRLLSLILAEATVLAVSSSVIGFLFGVIGLTALSFPSWGENALASLFLFQGHLKPNLPLPLVLFATVLLPVSCWLGAFFPAWKAVRMKPVDALRAGE